ncbi:MBOAT family protein [Proteiniclasticum sp. SCR006]|uniref:MBOAT family protein n=1 Tax=Proteiniclasticum aestuarii TaxID=2817862 RepID=A0A939H565_9CLOT|nr:MBOAT family protein [Proteiniclasticum aestuarii]MBO1264422.1 MBOAT family protein [Proteiniclasticum aestuarii]
MVFSSAAFIFYFLPLTLLLYHMVPDRMKNGVLLAVSLFFYGFGEPVYILIMVLSIFIDYFNGRLIEKYRHRKHLSKVFLVLSITANLGLLGFFKYGDFFIGNTNLLFGTDMELLSVALPIGISFFTFQTMSYSIDVYRGEISAQKNFITFGTYVSMFPQLIAGPIVIYRDVEKQLEKREADFSHLKEGIHRFILGLAKKVLLANSIGGLWEQVKMIPVEELTVLNAWIGAAAFSLQIYYDFSGYSDMAIGLGKLLGFDFLENFNYPFISRSITEFWRRWHISLSKWFRNYLYFPLGGNRRGKWITLRNIAVVWMLTGFWHGASWNYLLWGVYFAVVLILEKTFLGKILEKSGGILSRVYTLPVLLISFAVFALEDLSHLSGYLMVMLGRGAFADIFSLYLVDRYALLFLLLVLFATPWPYRTYLQFLERKGHAGDVVSAIVLLALFILSAAYIVDGAYNPFLYFRF